MDDLFEVILELLGLVFNVKRKQQTIADNEPYSPAFVVRYRASYFLRWAVIGLGACLLGAFLSSLEDRDSFWFMLAFLLGLGAVALLCRVGSYCSVDERCIVRRRLFVFCKTIPWDDVLCLRIITDTVNKNTRLALYGRDKKCRLELTTPMLHLRQLIKMAENGGVDIRAEENLTVKQIKRLP